MLFLRNAHKVCEQEVDYIKDIVKNVINSWICNEKIKKDILGYSKRDDLILNETIFLIESKEMAARAMSSQSPRWIQYVSNSSKSPRQTYQPSQKAPDEI